MSFKCQTLENFELMTFHHLSTYFKKKFECFELNVKQRILDSKLEKKYFVKIQLLIPDEALCGEK